MSEVDEEDQTEKDKNACAHHGNIVAPKHEKAVRDEERDNDKDQPKEGFRTPPAALSSVHCSEAS